MLQSTSLCCQNAEYKIPHCRRRFKPSLSRDLVGIESNPGPNTQRQRKNKNYRRNVKLRRANPMSETQPILINKNIRRADRVTATLPSGLQFFPDVLFAEATTNYFYNYSGGTTIALTFNAGSQFYNYGPQVNYTGSFSPNVPAGASYLLGSNSSSGSNGPYCQAWTYETDVAIEIVNGNAVPTYFYIVPSNNASLSGGSISSLAEQRGAVQILVPPSNNLPVTLSNYIKIYDVAGLTKDGYLNQPQYAQYVGNNPVLQTYFHIIIWAADNATNTSGFIRFNFRSKYKFGFLNTLKTSQPS